MLATLAKRPFSDASWLFERKLDGERCLAVRDGPEVRLRSRNRRDLNAAYPELVDAVASCAPERVVLDGEVIAFEGEHTSFARLQSRMQIADPQRARRSSIAVYYYLFDILHFERFDLTRLALQTRKSLLREAVDFADPLRFTVHHDEHGEALYAEACAKGWEGLVAKRADAPYVHRRSTDWLKLRCAHAQEFVVGGFTEPRGRRVGFGALLVGYYEGADLVYAGKVGAGYDTLTLRALRRRLDALTIEHPPFTAGQLPWQGVHWAAPRLVAEIRFTEWTADGRLRHPRFIGLRRDIDPAEVVRERA